MSLYFYKEAEIEEVVKSTMNYIPAAMCLPRRKDESSSIQRLYWKYQVQSYTQNMRLQQQFMYREFITNCILHIAIGEYQVT